MTFITEDFMLTNDAAKRLYETSKDMPIYDFHCHLDPQEIYEDKQFEDVTEVWLGGDHYKWRLMRGNGIPEHYITGHASSKEKFQAWAKTLSRAVGNPLYHWSHLEMYRVFGIDEHINVENWELIYARMNEVIVEKELSPRKLIAASNVKMIGTTDGPLDTLEWHEKLAADESFDTVVAPSFRPDEAFVEHDNFANFTRALAELTEIEITDFATFLDAMEDRIKYFANHGCQATDISLSEVGFYQNDDINIDDVFTRAMNAEVLSREEILVWQTELFTALCGLYKKYNFVTQLHFGARRNNNTKYFGEVGGDAGFDSIGDQTDLAENLNALLDNLFLTKRLPKMVIFNLNPAYNTVVANNLQNYQANEEGLVAPIQFGAAWWFGDTEAGMLDQMKALADQGMLANFIGMLTDSRSYLSYQRHEYFRRIVANLFGEWIEEGKVPEDYELLTGIIDDIFYNNANEFFNEN